MDANTLNGIFAHFGKNVKVIMMIRHGHKTPDGTRITTDCLKDIMDNGFPGLTTQVNVLQHGSEFIRTDQTGLAAALWILNNGGDIIKHLPDDYRLGHKPFFDLYTPEVKDLIAKNGWKNYETLAETNNEELQRFQSALSVLIKQIFNNIEENNVVLVPAHSPTVEAAFNFFAAEPDPRIEFKELEGICLVETESGKIVPVR